MKLTPSSERRPLKRIGHKGADLIEAGNTLASFDVAAGIGVDMIEFDVLRRGKRLVVAHDPHDAESRDGGSLVSLEEALDHLAGPRFAEIDLNIDLKHPGFELELVQALEARRLIERSTITTMHRSSIALIRSQQSGLRVGLTIPLVSRDWLSVPAPVKLLVAVGIAYHRLFQPARVRAMLRRGEIDLVTAFHSVISKRLVRAVQEQGGEIYAWTIDDEPTIRRLTELGVDGIVSNDPRLFAPLVDVVTATA